jgi:hypothetical protein
VGVRYTQAQGKIEVRVECIVRTDGTVTVKAIDLTGDSWRDYIYYLEEAQNFEEAEDQLGRNRSLRAALMNLFSHLDGVVSGLYERLQETEENSPLREARKNERCSLKTKMLDLKDHAEGVKGTRLPYINLGMKPIRDILAHPSITKPKRNSSGIEDAISEIEVFDVTTTQLNECGQMIDKWLNRVSDLYDYPRQYDTRAICEEFGETLSGTTSEPTEV